MNKTCDIVQDLLPLYIDGICSDASRQMIDEHLKNCPDCSAVWKHLNNTEIETKLEKEKTDVVKRQAKKFKRRSAFAGAIVAGILMIPVLICLIINLAAGSGLSWFFIVLASLMLSASLIVTPLMMPSNKCLWTLGLSTAALILLLGVCSIYSYSDGRWFFVAAPACLFGLAVIFMPFVVRSQPLHKYIGNNKGLVCMSVDTLLYLLMIVCIGFYAGKNSYPQDVFQVPDYPQTAFQISVCLVIPAWIIFAVLRYLPGKKLFRAGICCMILGFIGFAAENILYALRGEALSWPKLTLLTWNYTTLGDNIKYLMLLAGLFIGILLIFIGLTKGKKK